MLDPRRLRLLVLLDGLGTVRAVAEAASMSPSAVSQQLAVLEREAGASLLERHGRRVALTGAGVALAGHGRAILARIGVAEEDLRAVQEDAIGTVSIAAFTSAMRGFVIAAAAAMRTAHPGVALRLEELEPVACVAALERGDADLAVVGDFGDGTLAHVPHLASVALTTDAMLAVLPAGRASSSPPPAGANATHGRAPVRFADLREDAWLLDGTSLEDWVVRHCRRAGFEPRVAGRLFSHEALLHAVRAGLGVTVLPAFALDAPAGVAVCELVPAQTRELAVLHRPDAVDRRSVALALDALVAAATT